MYDIRGVYPGQINEQGVYAIGRAYATLMRREIPEGSITVAVGSDARLSSPSLKAKLITALLESGLNVFDIGLVSTPTFYFGVASNNFLGGLQVSASHNPKEWNGIKIVRQHAVPVSGETGIEELYTIITNESYIQPATQPGVLSEKKGVVEAFAEEQASHVDLKNIKPFKVVVDAASGMGALDMVALFKHLPCQLVAMNFEVDGTFPVHPADPMIEANTAELRKRVVEEKADLGIVLDGDADRYFFVDEKGEMLPQAILRGLMAQIELLEHPGVKVAYDIRPGRITRDMIEELGGQAVVTKVGHSLIKETMIREGAVFGGESSGHYMYQMPYGTFEMPLLLTLKLLKFLSDQNKTFSEIVQPLKRYAHSGEINTKVSSRDVANEKIEVIKEKYSDGTFNDLDGITIEYPDVWFNVRASNTEPVLRLTVEAKTQELMEQKRDELLALIRS